MKRAFIENKLEQAAKNGDTKKIKELLNEPDAVQVTSSMEPSSRKKLHFLSASPYTKPSSPVRKEES